MPHLIRTPIGVSNRGFHYTHLYLTSSTLPTSFFVTNRVFHFIVSYPTYLISVPLVSLIEGSTIDIRSTTPSLPSQAGQRNSCSRPGWRTPLKPARRLESSSPPTLVPITWTPPRPSSLPLVHPGRGTGRGSVECVW